MMGKNLRFSIPHEDRDEFYRLYVQNIQVNGHHDEYNAMVEKTYSPQAFRYFMDIDFDLGHFTSTLLKAEDFENCLDCIKEHSKRVIAMTFGIDAPEVIVSRRLAYKVHFNCPTVVVDKETAVKMTCSIRNYMATQYPAVLPDGKSLWEKALDTSVYNTTGLRMIWSHKGKPEAKDDAYKQEVQLYKELFPGFNRYLHYNLFDSTGQPIAPDVDIVKKLSIQAAMGEEALKVANNFFLKPSEEADGFTTRVPVAPVFGHGDVPVDTRAKIQEFLKEELDTINGFEMDPSIEKIRRLGRDGNIEVTLKPQVCPFASREHRRTARDSRPSNWILITPFATSYRCWRCTNKSHEIDHIPQDIIEELFDINTEEIRARRALTIATDEAVSEFIFHTIKGIHSASHAGAKTYLWYKYDQKQHRWDKRDVLVEEIMHENGPIQKLLGKYARRLHDREQQLKQDMRSELEEDDDTSAGANENETKKSKEKPKKTFVELFAMLRRNLQSFSYVNGHLMPVLGLKLHNYNLCEGKTFQEQLDQNPKLLGFKNGVFDFVKGEFRCGRPQDMISMTTGTFYRPYNEYDSAILEPLQEFLRKIFPEKEELYYVLQELGNCLDGEQTEQKFFFMTGFGANGKSTIVRLLNLAMGDYSGETSITLFTQPRPPANAPVPELMALRGKRFVSCAEPNAKDVLNFGTIKWLTGGDRITGRNLFEKQQSFYLQSTFFCCCNDIPNINASDFGTWRRIRTVPFSSQFVMDREPARPNEFKADEQLERKMQKWKDAFCSLLLKFCTERRKHPMPRKFKETYDKLKHDNDVYSRFASDCIIRGNPNDSELMPVTEIFDVFVAWKKRFQVKKADGIELGTFYRNMQQILGPGIERGDDGDRTKRWYGWFVDLNRSMA
ncbi:hypothetical protein GGF32_001676 [Allomyces javanicus]|nr:hypothetical protein GGF32_001676 [Allomyces javanicus]